MLGASLWTKVEGLVDQYRGEAATPGVAERAPAEADAHVLTSGNCRECKQPLVDIDNRRRHLTGCVTCNIWWSTDGMKVRLSEEDLRALHAMRRV